MEWTAQSTHIASHQDINNDQKIEIPTDAEERYLIYILLKHSAKTSDKLRTNLSDDCTTGENKYPTSRQETIHYLDKHKKSVVCAPIARESSSLAQIKGNGNTNTFDKNYWKDKECYRCGDKVHPELHYKTKLDSNK